MHLCNEFDSMRVANKYISESESESESWLTKDYGSSGMNKSTLLNTDSCTIARLKQDNTNGLQ